MLSFHLKKAHDLWKNHLRIDATVIDATVGNGFDSLELAKLILREKNGSLIGFDIQKKAIENTKKLLGDNLSPMQLENVFLFLSSHEDFSCINRSNINLVVYNLGYLPRSDKKIKTKITSTLISIKNAINILAPNGALCITCYPGHVEGKEEEIHLVKYFENLNPRKWEVCFYRWINKKNAPSIIWAKKLDQG
jgi:hypothetical protein